MLSVLAQDLTTSGSNDAASGGLIGVIVVISLVWLVISLAALWKIFVKMGEPGWKGIIPIYSQYIIFTRAGKPGWWVILLFVPCINYVALWFLADALGNLFGKGTGYKIALFLLSPIMYLVLGFGDSRYVGPAQQRAAL